MTISLVFLAMTALDFVYAEWAKACADRRPMAASLYAALLILLAGYVTRSYVEDAWMLIPACLGAFAGTWLSVRFVK